jgi:hypothetical protein
LKEKRDILWRAGATAVIFDTAGSDLAKSIPDELSVDKVHYAHCGERLYFATIESTREETAEFAKESRIPNAEVITERGWLVPGVYCRNNCGWSPISHHLMY